MKSKFKSYKWIVWGVLILIYLIVFFQRLSVGAIAGDLKSTFGMNATQIANLGAMYFYAYTLMQIPTGILADKLGPRITVVSGSLLAGAASIMFSFSSSIGMAYVSRLLVGIGVSVVFLSILKIISIWFPAGDFATMSGLTSFMGNMGGLFAQAPLVIVVGIIGWRGSFFAMGIATLVLAVSAFILVKDSPADIGLPEVNPKPEKSKEDAGEESLNIFVKLFHVVRNPKIWFPAIAFGGLNGSFILFSGTFGISYLGYAYNMDKIAASSIISIAILSAAVANIFMGRLTDTLRLRKLPTIALAVISLVAWSSLVFMDLSGWLIYPFAILMGASTAVGAMCWSVGKEVSNPMYSGMALSIINVTGCLFGALMPVICGRIIDISIAGGAAPLAAYQNGFLACIGGSLLGLLFSMLMKETKCQNVYSG
ncbi:MAG: MFS transporter [Clostridiaceae bacterium]